MRLSSVSEANGDAMRKILMDCVVLSAEEIEQDFQKQYDKMPWLENEKTGAMYTTASRIKEVNFESYEIELGQFIEDQIDNEIYFQDDAGELYREPLEEGDCCEEFGTDS
jgi:hypothetical protein